MIIKSSYLMIILFVVSLVTMGTHPFAKVKQLRPGEIDTSPDKYSEGGSIRVTYYTDQEAVPMNKIHSWRLILENKDGSPIKNAEIVISPDMPEHLHGMTTKPEIVEGTVEGEYLVNGMNFHMPGWWEVTLDVTTVKTRDLIRFQLLVGEDMPNQKEHNH